MVNKIIYGFIMVIMLVTAGCNDRDEVNLKSSELLMNIEYGSSFDTLKNKIGSPDRYEGKVLKYAVYNLEDEGYAQVFQRNDIIEQIYIFDKNDECTYTLFSEMKDANVDLKDKITIDEKEIHYNKAMCNLSIEDFKNITEDYNYDDVILAVGQPVDYIGSGMLADLYILNDGTIVLLRPCYGDRGFVSILHYNVENGRLRMIEKIK